MKAAAERLHTAGKNNGDFVDEIVLAEQPSTSTSTALMQMDPFERQMLLEEMFLTSVRSLELHALAARAGLYSADLFPGPQRRYPEASLPFSHSAQQTVGYSLEHPKAGNSDLVGPSSRARV